MRKRRPRIQAGSGGLRKEVMPLVRLLKIMVGEALSLKMEADREFKGAANAKYSTKAYSFQPQLFLQDTREGNSDGHAKFGRPSGAAKQKELARTTKCELYPRKHLLKAVVERMIFTHKKIAFTNKWYRI